MNNDFYNSSINIEKIILNSIFFKPELLDEVSKIITAKDFYLQSHKNIYEGMLLLEDIDYPIDEEFLSRKCKNIDREVVISIMSTTPFSNIAVYIEELKVDSLKRQMELNAQKIAHGDIEAIDILTNLKEEFENIGNVRKLKTVEEQDRHFESQDMKPKVVENSKFEWLIEDFLVKNEITMFAALPNIGKSLTGFALSNMLLENKKIKTVFYLDGDMGGDYFKCKRQS